MMKFKRFTALFVVLVLLCVFMVVPASAAEPSVFTASYNEDNHLILDALPLPGEYTISFTYCEFDTCVVVADPVMLSHVELDGLGCLLGIYVHDFPHGSMEITVLIIEDTCEVLVGPNNEPFEVPIDNFTLTPVAVNGPDSEPTTNNLLADIGIFFASCMKMLSDVLGIVINSPVLLVSVLAIPAIFFVISIASRLKT